MFIFGAKDSSVACYYFKTNTMVPISSRGWERSGLFKVTTHHGDVVHYGDKLYVFGGQNKDKTISNELFSFDLNPKPTHQTNWSRLLGNEPLSDVTFVVEGRDVPAHRAVLFAQCAYFRALFS